MIPDFWGLLRVFWEDERVDSWKREIFPDPSKPETGVEACFNLICLNAHAHDLWTKRLFALKPLEISDDKELTVQFFWQPQYDHKPQDRIDLLTQLKSSKGLHSIEEDYFLTYHRDGRPEDIESGQIFKITTENPEKYPLPSWELLQMQWFLQRLVAMSGAASWPRIDFDDDDDDDDTECSPVLVKEINSQNWGYEDVYNWIPGPQESEPAWSNAGNREYA